MNLKETDLKMPFCVMLAAVSVMSAVSCVNKEYDLNKDIDTTIKIEGDISAPLGSTEAIMIGDFLSIDGENSVIKADPETGDYSLEIKAEEPINQSISINNIDIAPDELIHDGGFGASIRVKELVREAIGGVPADSYEVGDTQITDVDLLAGQPQSSAVSIDQDIRDITGTVKALGTVYIDAPLNLELKIGEGKVTIDNGMKLAFPEFVSISLDGTYDYCSISNGHILTIDRQVDVEAGTPLTVKMKMTEIRLGDLHEAFPEQGLVGDRLIVDQDIVISDLRISARARDFGETFGDMPDVLRMDITMNAARVEVTGGTAVIEPEITVADQTIPVGKMPEFLTGENMVLDIYNPVIRLDVNNTSPVTALFSARLQGYDAGGKPTMAEPMAIGSQDKSSSEAILMKPGKTSIYISAKAISLDVDDIYPLDENPPRNVVIPDLPEIVRTIPHDIIFSDISIAVPHEGNATDGYKDGDYVLITFPAGGSGLTYTFTADYSIDVPLSFGDKLHIEYPYDITGLNGTLNPDNGDNASADDGMTINLKRAQIKMTFVNAIPLDMGVTASPIDIDGNVITDPALKVELQAADGGDALISAGDIGREASCPSVINVEADAESLKKLDGFRLNITGSAGTGYIGTALNANQYVRITDMSVRIEGGVEMQL